MQPLESIESPSILSYLRLCFGALFVVVMLLIVLSTLGLFPGFRHIETIKVAMSPDQKLKAVVYLEKYDPINCSVNISVLNSSAELESGRDGNIFSQWKSDWADAKWIDNHSLLVTHTDSSYCRVPETFTAFDRDLQIRELALKGYLAPN